MPPVETGKQRSQRIELDYYRQRGGLAHSKVALSGVAAVFGIAAIVYSSTHGSVANPAPIAEAHAHFEQDCSSCHTALTPIAKDSVRELSIPPLLDVNHAKSVQNTFTKCTACHQGSHPIDNHYKDKMVGDWHLVDENCALCHADHQGRSFDLTHVANDSCVVCHEKLSEVCDGSKQVVQKQQTSITAFSKSGHGDFLSLAAGDTGRIKFDHAQHLLPGQSRHGEAGKDAMKLDRIDPELRPFYRANENGFVVLDCDSCHQLDGAASGSTGSLASASELGKYMQPISFDRHCSACHQANPAGRVEGTLPIPHAAPWSEVDRWIATRLLIKKQNEIGNPLKIGPQAEVPDSSDVPDEPSGELTSLTLARQWLDGNDKPTLRLALEKQCSTCHVDDLTTDAAITKVRESGSPMVPDRWLVHGIYDHAAHPAVACVHCHQQVGKGDPLDDPKDHQTLMIGGVETCTDCHRAADALPENKDLATHGGHTQWASDSCVLCHRYHTTPAEATQ